MVSFVPAASVCAQEHEATAYRLEDVKYIDSFVGSKEAKELLAKQGFVVTRQQFTQIFAAYLKLDQSKPWLPNFVTEDSAWHAYHVLLEEGVRQLEQHQATVLRQFSTRLLEVTQKRSRKSGDLHWDLAAFAAVGLALQDSDAVSSLEPDLRKVVSGITKAIESGSEPARVLFFGLPIAPERFRAASFYVKEAELRGYFVARQWYAICDFRLKSSAETERAVHLALLIDSDEELKTLYDQLCKPYGVFVGPPDDAGVAEYVELAKETIGQELRADQISAALETFRQQASRLPDPKVNDQLLLPAQYARFAEQTKGFRLLPARRCPSAVLLQRTSHPLIQGRMLPTGVDLFAAGPLACEAGRRALRASVENQGVYDAVVGAEAEPLPDSLHGKALGLLKLLQQPLPKSAPAPLQTAAWQDKQLWTSLGAWAEQRHTWAAHIKLSITVLDGDEQPPGFVSPYPEFFRGLGQLARQTADTIARFRAEPDPKTVGQEILQALDVDKTRDYRGLSEKGAHLIATARKRLFGLHYEYCHEIKNLDTQEYSRWPDRTETLERLARRWIKGKNLDADDWELIRRWALPRERDPVKLLPRFASMCDRLAEIAQKELERQPLDDKDAQFLQGYGDSLASYHFYDSYAWMNPEDDFPLVSPVFLNPLTGQILYAGLGRPEALYVILNIDGKPVLHRGAVLSYREFPRPASEPTNDDSWTAEVKAGQAPPPPEFTMSFRNVTTAPHLGVWILVAIAILIGLVAISIMGRRLGAKREDAAET